MKYTIALPKDVVGSARVTIIKGEVDEDFFYSKVEDTIDVTTDVLTYYADTGFNVKVELEPKGPQNVVETYVFCTDVQAGTNDSGDVGIVEYSYFDDENILMVIRETKDTDDDSHKIVRFGTIKYNIKNNTYTIMSQKAFDIDISGINTETIYPLKQEAANGIINYIGIADRMDNESLIPTTVPIACRVNTNTGDITGITTNYGSINPPKNSDDGLNDYAFVVRTLDKAIGVFRFNGSAGDVSGYEVTFDDIYPVNPDNFCVKTSDGKYVFPFAAHQKDFLYVAIFDPDTNTLSVKMIIPENSGVFYNAGAIVRILDLTHYVEDGKDKILLALIQDTANQSVKVQSVSFIELEYSNGDIALTPKQSIVTLTDTDYEFAKYSLGSLVGPDNGYFYFATTVKYSPENEQANWYFPVIIKLGPDLSVVASRLYKTVVLHRTNTYLKLEDDNLRMIISSYYTSTGTDTGKVGTQLLTVNKWTLELVDIPSTISQTNIVTFDNTDYALTGSSSSIYDVDVTVNAKTFPVESATEISSELTIYVCTDYNYDNSTQEPIGPYPRAYYYYYYYYYYGP